MRIFSKTAFKDFRAMFRSDGVRERAAFRARGYGWLATSCAVGLIVFGAATTMRPQYSIVAAFAVVGAFIAAVVSLNVMWHFSERLSLAIESFNVYHNGFGPSFDSFEVALEKFASVDARSYSIASRRLRVLQKAACDKQERAMESYVRGMRRVLA